MTSPVTIDVTLPTFRPALGLNASEIGHCEAVLPWHFCGATEKINFCPGVINIHRTNWISLVSLFPTGFWATRLLVGIIPQMCCHLSQCWSQPQDKIFSSQIPYHGNYINATEKCNSQIFLFSLWFGFMEVKSSERGRCITQLVQQLCAHNVLLCTIFYSYLLTIFHQNVVHNSEHLVET